MKHKTLTNMLIICTNNTLNNSITSTPVTRLKSNIAMSHEKQERFDTRQLSGDHLGMPVPPSLASSFAADLLDFVFFALVEKEMSFNNN